MTAVAVIVTSPSTGTLPAATASAVLAPLTVKAEYRADFAYERPTRPDAAGVVYWIPVVEDVKSKATATDKYKLKKKLMLEKFNITVKEV